MATNYEFDTQERLLLSEIMDVLEQVTTADELVACTDGVMQKILPHFRLGCGIGNFHASGAKPTHLLLNRFPRQYVEQYMRQPSGDLNSPLMARWFQTRVPVIVDPEYRDESDWPADWLALQKAMGFRNCVVHGLCDLAGGVASYFSFMDLPGPLGERHTNLMARLVPHLHIALVRCMVGIEDTAATAAANSLLTTRQQEVLRWLRMGKTNWEIGRIIGASEETVKEHVSQILACLNADNRTQAVAKAFLLNIIA